MGAWYKHDPLTMLFKTEVENEKQKIEMENVCPPSASVKFRRVDFDAAALLSQRARARSRAATWVRVRYLGVSLMML